MTQFKKGDYVRYKNKDEIGVVKEVFKSGNSTCLRCWWHMGGTAATIDTNLVDKLTFDEVKNHTFSNEYAKNSLIIRRKLFLIGEDVSDLIESPKEGGEHTIW